MNNSKSKALYSFPKSKRFNDNRNSLCDNFYNYIDTKMT